MRSNVERRESRHHFPLVILSVLLYPVTLTASENSEPKNISSHLGMSERFNKKRKRTDWKDLPAFLDASASVSATTFGARRLPEIKALWNAQLETTLATDQKLQSSGGKTSSRHLRRRTTSHKPRRRHPHPRGRRESENCQAANNNKRPCRRARRKPVLLRQQHETWQTDIRDTRTSSPEHVYWLPTHLWHAKRFHLHDNLFGWKVPLVHANRGARAALRMASEDHTLLQDVTWRMQPICIGSTDLKALVSSVQRICPNLLSANHPNAILSGNSFGEGIVYGIDKFPTNAIGPAMWWMSGKPLDSSLEVEQKRQWWLHIFVHPAIRSTIRNILSVLSNNLSSLEEPRGMKGGIACFQVRGRKATASIQQALGPVACKLDDAGENTSCTFDWGNTVSILDLHTKVPHLTAISVRVSLNGKYALERPNESERNDDADGYIESYKERVQQLDPTERLAPPSIGDCRIILVARCESDTSVSQNAAVSGWDLFCHPSDGSNIFHALENAGEARAIGLVEEYLTRMDSEPPLPVFPRDYPDTPAGQCYWEGSSSTWQLLRKCIEQGWGRVHIVKSKHKKIADDKASLPVVSWGHISTLPENASNSGNAAAVVRGDFGRPFMDAFAGCGHLPLVAPQGDKTKTRRPRRPVRPPSVSIQLGRLSNEEADRHENTCETLLLSLSLPALIRCHIKIDGKGTLTGGGRILASMCDNEEQTGYIEYLLGTTVAGSFSLSRGLAHGVGFVGAARLLHVLGSDYGRSSCVAVNRPNGTRHIELQVSIKSSARGSVERAATLSLLL